MNTMRTAIFGKDLKAPELKSREGKTLYERLSILLARHGQNDSLGKGDFFLVGDEVGEPGQKIELTNPDVLTPAPISPVHAPCNSWRSRG